MVNSSMDMGGEYSTWPILVVIQLKLSMIVNISVTGITLNIMGKSKTDIYQRYDVCMSSPRYGLLVLTITLHKPP